MMHWYGGGMMVSNSPMGGFVALIAVALVTVGVVALLRASRGGSLGLGRSHPEEILDERLARGEIDVEEYNRSRAALRRSGSTDGGVSG